MFDIKALRAAMNDEEEGAAWIAGEDLRKEALGGSPLPEGYHDASSGEDTRAITVKELLAIKDPEERKRYIADMAARNHRTAIDKPSSTREAVATQKSASLKVKIKDLVKGK